MGRKQQWFIGWVASVALSTTVAVAQDTQTQANEGPDYPDGAYAYAIGDYPASRVLFAEECRRGEVKSCLRVADDWRIGRGGPQDLTKAIDFATDACSLSASDGCTLAATIHFEGRATGSTDYESARVLYQRACELSDLRGCAGLGNMQYMGLGGLRDRREGIENLRRACRQDFTYACDQLRGYGQSR